MKITASKIDDIIRQRDEYDAETQRLQDLEDAEDSMYEEALSSQEQDLEKKISDIIGPTSISLYVRCDPYGSFRSRGWSVRVEANERNKFEDSVALAWNWSASLDEDGNVIKDSGSWSGLKAVTADQVANLEESVRIIKILNSMDWNDLLTSPLAKYSDYHSAENHKAFRDRKTNRPNFEGQLLDEMLSDSIGTNTVFKLKQDQFYNGLCGILVTGMTDKFIKGYIFPWSWVTGQGYPNEQFTRAEIIDSLKSERRTGKSNLVMHGGQPVSAELVDQHTSRL